MSTTTSEKVAFDPAGLGAWTEPSTFEVTAERIAAYAEATNDPIAAHRSAEVASPVFAVVPVFQAMMEPVLEIVPLNHFGRVVHGEQDFIFHRAIRPGDVLTTRARGTGYEGLPNGSRVVMHLECRDADGDLVNEQYVTCFFRGIDAGPLVGELSPGHKLDVSLRDTEPVATADAHVDDDQTFRYSPASGDPMPIHLDEQVALDSGLPGIIAHGLCTMAMASWGVLTQVGDGDVHRLKRLAVRFSAMVRPGDDLRTRIWETVPTAGPGDGPTTYAFETTATGPEGTKIALTDGLAEIH